MDRSLCPLCNKRPVLRNSSFCSEDCVEDWVMNWDAMNDNYYCFARKRLSHIQAIPKIRVARFRGLAAIGIDGINKSTLRLKNGGHFSIYHHDIAGWLVLYFPPSETHANGDPPF